jgi:hypothetical protein
VLCFLKKGSGLRVSRVSLSRSSSGCGKSVASKRRSSENRCSAAAPPQLRGLRTIAFPSSAGSGKAQGSGKRHPVDLAALGIAPAAPAAASERRGSLGAFACRHGFPGMVRPSQRPTSILLRPLARI